MNNQYIIEGLPQYPVVAFKLDWLSRTLRVELELTREQYDTIKSSATIELPSKVQIDRIAVWPSNRLAKLMKLTVSKSNIIGEFTVVFHKMENIKAMADNKPALKLTQYKLPTGALIHARKPNNGDRRLLMELPDMNRSNAMEALAALCVVKIEYLEGHEKWPEGQVFDFDPTDRKDPAMKLDEVDLDDAVSYIEAFGANNWPSDVMIKQVIDSSKAKN